MRQEDTITAVSTPAGEAGIGIVRISGPEALRIADRMFSSPKRKRPSLTRTHRILYGYIYDPWDNASQVDEVLLSIMRAPNTYTREDMVEINCHGGAIPLRRTLQIALGLGARLALPGEFTKRAFLNGRIDLSQAEAVLDIIRAKSLEAERAALEQLKGGLSAKINACKDALAGACAGIEARLDFPEEELEPLEISSLRTQMETVLRDLRALLASYEEGRLVREGIKTAIVGKPNVGKSSLLNALLGEERAIVTEEPGTTRDTVSECMNIGGFTLVLIDTAGIRESHSMAEKEGVKRSLRAIDEADLVIAVLDGSALLTEEDSEVLGLLTSTKQKHIIAVNKSDVGKDTWAKKAGTVLKDRAHWLRISAKTGAGLDELKEKIKGFIRTPGAGTPGLIVTNLRHKVLLEQAEAALGRTLAALVEGAPLEIVSLELRDALQGLGGITGAVTSEDILNRIFSEFCLGK
jgi:tRNA modification GTPase